MVVKLKRYIDPSDAAGILADRDSAQTGITANPGGGQANAVLLTAAINRVMTAGTAGDSVKLPPAIPGLSLFVTNRSGVSITIYPSTGDRMNVLVANAGYALATAKSVQCFCSQLGSWDTILTA